MPSTLRLVLDRALAEHDAPAVERLQESSPRFSAAGRRPPAWLPSSTASCRRSPCRSLPRRGGFPAGRLSRRDSRSQRPRHPRRGRPMGICHIPVVETVERLLEGHCVERDA
jgi:hypothetical protein